MTEPERELDERIAKFAARRERARARRGRSLWAQASRVGTVGWLVAVPIAVGALLGHLLDERLGTGITFAMAFIAVGVVAGGYALWRLGFDIREEEDGEAPSPPPTAPSPPPDGERPPQPERDPP
ncbi:MAG: AtpZ/AtpI family protein [Myxococcales bacterium]|nr:AtpZ/AtpI family protein [Myxococcales bacterium]